MKRITVGPLGCGKTTWIMSAVDRLLQSGAAPDEICVVTFTRVAVEEVKNRLIASFPDLSYRDFPWVGTLHSLCLRLLGHPAEQLFTGSWMTDFGEEHHYKFTQVHQAQAEEDIEVQEYMLMTAGDYYEHFDSWHRSCLLDFDRGWGRYCDPGFLGRAPWDWTLACQRQYCQRKISYLQANRLMDFTGLLETVADRGISPPISYLLIDESQDNSPLMWRVLEAWGRACGDITAVFDPNQSIYSFQGADPQQCLDFARGAQRLDLQNSFRLPRAIQALSEKWIAQNRVRLDRVLLPRDAPGVVQTHCQMTDFPFDDWAIQADHSRWNAFVLARTRYQANQFKKWFIDRGLPFATNRGAENPLQSEKGRLAHALIKLKEGERVGIWELAGVDKWVASRPWLVHGAKKKLAAAIKQSSLQQVGCDNLRDLGFKPEFYNALWGEGPEQFLEPLKFTDAEKAYLRRVYRRYGRKAFTDPPRILVTNIHGVKGMEANHVVLCPDLTQRPADGWLFTSREEEARVCYVGITRAREGLYILRPETSTYYPLWGALR